MVMQPPNGYWECPNLNCGYQKPGYRNDEEFNTWSEHRCPNPDCKEILRWTPFTTQHPGPRPEKRY